MEGLKKIHEQMRFARACLKEENLAKLRALVLRTPVEDVAGSVVVLIQKIRELQASLEEERQRTATQMSATADARREATVWHMRATRCNEMLKKICKDVEANRYLDPEGLSYYAWPEKLPWEN